MSKEIKMKMYNVTIKENGMAGTMKLTDILAESMIDAMTEATEFYCNLFGLGDATIDATAERVEEKA